MASLALVARTANPTKAEHFIESLLITEFVSLPEAARAAWLDHVELISRYLEAQLKRGPRLAIGTCTLEPK